MLTATDIANLARCAQRTFLDAHGDAAEKLPPSTVRHLLWDEGREHEMDVIAELECVTVPHVASAERLARTRDLMQQGVPLIYHGYLEAMELVGEPDLLQRIEQPSALGGHAYVPVEIKNGGAFTTPKKTRAKLPYALQLCAYAELLAAEQGWWPSYGIVIDHRDEWQRIDLEPHRRAYALATARVLAIREGGEVPGPGWKAECANCAWQEHCWKELVAADDLTTLPKIGEPKRAALVQIGIRTVADLAAARPEQLIEAKGIGEAAARLLPLRARAVKTRAPIVLASWTPPVVDFEVSYDIENTPEPFVYLHGFLTRPAGSAPWGSPGFTDASFGTFDAICAVHPQAEEDIWRCFLARVETLQALGSYAVYVYSSHERSTLRRLARAYGGSSALDHFLERMVDLRRALARTVVLPTDGDSLKAVAHFLGFTWRDGDPGGGQSIAWWSAYWRDPTGSHALRDRVLSYNEDDVRASFVVRDWLKAIASGEVRRES